MNYFNKIKNSNISLIKIMLVMTILLYMFYYLVSLPDWHFIDNVNLIFHEAGHTIFSFFGIFINIIGGTLMQILVPIIFSIYFYKNKDYFSASLLLFWISQNFFNIYVYVKDAVKMELPLLGGEGVYHDWNYILSSLGLLKQTEKIASLIYFIGIIVLVFATVFSLRFSNKNHTL